MKKLKNYKQYITEGLNIDDYENQDIEPEKYSFNQVKELDIFYICLYFKEEENLIGNYIDDVIIDDDHEYEIDYHRHERKLEIILIETLKSYISNLNKLQFHYIKHILINTAIIDKPNVTISDVDIYFSQISIDSYLNFLDYAFVGVKLDEKSIYKYIDDEISKDSNVINDDTFIELLNNCDSMKTKYSHLLNAKKFDLL